MRRIVLVFAVVLLSLSPAPFAPLSGPLHAAEDWQAEFVDICSKTEDPMALPKDEIKKLIERCDKLKPRIEKLDESTRKVYLKRLQMCRDLFVFVLESQPPSP